MKSDSINVNIVIDGEEILWETKNVIKKNMFNQICCMLLNQLICFMHLLTNNAPAWVDDLGTCSSLNKFKYRYACF